MRKLFCSLATASLLAACSGEYKAEVKISSTGNTAPTAEQDAALRKTIDQVFAKDPAIKEAMLKQLEAQRSGKLRGWDTDLEYATARDIYVVLGCPVPKATEGVNMKMQKKYFSASGSTTHKVEMSCGHDAGKPDGFMRAGTLDCNATGAETAEKAAASKRLCARSLQVQ